MALSSSAPFFMHVSRIKTITTTKTNNTQGNSNKQTNAHGPYQMLTFYLVFFTLVLPINVWQNHYFDVQFSSEYFV